MPVTTASEAQRQRKTLKVFLSVFISGILLIILGSVLIAVAVNKFSTVGRRTEVRYSTYDVSYDYNNEENMKITAQGTTFFLVGIVILAFSIPYFLSSFVYLIIQKTWRPRTSVPPPVLLQQTTYSIEHQPLVTPSEIPFIDAQPPSYSDK